MISVICPYCGETKCILFDPVMNLLIREGKGTTKCDKCSNEFIVYNGKTQIEVKIK